MDLFLLKLPECKYKKQEVSSGVDETNQSIAASASQREDFQDVILSPLTSSLPAPLRLWQLYQELIYFHLTWLFCGGTYDRISC